MTECELAILGGGISGLGVARAAARAGIDTLLVERGDLAGGASSASSHMLHGGLRYLEQGQVGLVREALRQRTELLRMAPGLTTPCRFVVPVYGGSRVGLLRLRAGLALYDMLAGRSRLEPAAVADAHEARRRAPGLARAGLLGAGLYSDGVMDDARLAIAVARDAAGRGARLLAGHEVTDARRVEGGRVELTLADRLGEGAAPGEAPATVVRARVLLNATGAACDATRRWLLPRLGAGPALAEVAPLLAPSRGVHLVYPELVPDVGVLFFAQDDGRVIFLVPFAGRTLVGTTEAAVPSPPAPTDYRATAAEVRYLRREVARVVPAAAELRPLAATSGLRPLLADQHDAGSASREHRVVAEGPLITLAGGKYTTFRVMAQDALRAAWPRLRRTGAPPAESREPLGLSAAPTAAAEGPADEAGLDALAERAVRHEFARRLEDVVRRRSHLWLEDDRGRAALPALTAALARRLGWTPERAAAERARVENAWAFDDDLIRRSEEEL